MASTPGPARAPHAFRVIDTGLRPGRAQIAFDQAMIDLHKAHAIADTIRFLRFPPTVLIGRHQALSREVRVAWCRANGIGIVRRITGGGAIWFDEGQLGWSLVFDRATLPLPSLAELARAICEAAAAGLRRLGVDAHYRPRNDIEVDGRKLSGTGGFFDGDTLFYQGTVLVDMDAQRMLAALNVPEAKLARRNLDTAAQRVVTLKELLGTAPPLDEIRTALVAGFTAELGISATPGAITEREEALARHYHDEEIGTDAFVASIDEPGDSGDAGATGAQVRSATRTGPGGTITAWVRVEGPRLAQLREVLLTGDFFVAPPRTVLDLEAALRGTPTAEVRATVQRFFAAAKPGLLSVAPEDFAEAIAAAVGSAAAPAAATAVPGTPS
ncbi:MAG: lipoate--protein ligase family protein [Proteobacteria bacterium]|jgi:lipoate-protein ligase A|nr:lipoate--protein ligase family protein [Pseudomonadota bacterium]